MSRCYSIAGSAGVERTIPFKMGWVAVGIDTKSLEVLDC
jgi:hypothetical protein